MISIIGDTYYSNRSLYGIHQAYCIETKTILLLQERGIKYVVIRHVGGGINAGKIFKTKMTDFTDCSRFISIKTLSGELQRGIKFANMKELDKEELKEFKR